MRITARQRQIATRSSRAAQQQIAPTSPEQNTIKVHRRDHGGCAANIATLVT